MKILFAFVAADASIRARFLTLQPGIEPDAGNITEPPPPPPTGHLEELPPHDEDLHHEDIGFPHPEVETVEANSLEWDESPSGCKCDHGSFWNPNTQSCIEQQGPGYECGFFPAEIWHRVCVDGYSCAPLDGVEDTYASDGYPATCNCACEACNATCHPVDRHEADCVRGISLTGEACATVNVRVQQEEEHTAHEGATETTDHSATEIASATAEHEETAEVESASPHMEDTQVTGEGFEAATAIGSSTQDATATATASATATAAASTDVTVTECVSADEALKHHGHPSDHDLGPDAAREISRWADDHAFRLAFEEAIAAAAKEAGVEASELAEEEAEEEAESEAEFKARKKAEKRSKRKAERKAKRKAERRAKKKAKKAAKREAKRDANKKVAVEKRERRMKRQAERNLISINKSVTRNSRPTAKPEKARPAPTQNDHEKPIKSMGVLAL